MLCEISEMFEISEIFVKSRDFEILYTKNYSSGPLDTIYASTLSNLLSIAKCHDVIIIFVAI